MRKLCQDVCIAAFTVTKLEILELMPLLRVVNCVLIFKSSSKLMSSVYNMYSMCNCDNSSPKDIIYCVCICHTRTKSRVILKWPIG